MTSALLDRLTTTFGAAADPDAATTMTTYMRGRFTFLGIATPRRRALTREILRETPKRPGEGELIELARACWTLPEREYRYFACDVLIKHVRALTPAFIPVLHDLATTDPWWDTIDPLAIRVAGPLVAAHPQLAAVMDEWIAGEDLWLVRVALLHQMFYRENTDTRRLFDYCTAQAEHPDFFVRKAIGWILRQYAKTDPDAVRAYVATTPLSPLSEREALKNIGP